MTIQDGTVLEFGIDSPQKNYGLVQSYTATDSVNRRLCTGPDGAIVAIQEFGEQSSLTATYIQLSSSTDDPEIGDKFIFAGSTWCVDNIVDERSVDGFATKTVEASYYYRIF